MLNVTGVQVYMGERGGGARNQLAVQGNVRNILANGQVLPLFFITQITVIG